MQWPFGSKLKDRVLVLEDQLARGANALAEEEARRKRKVQDLASCKSVLLSVEEDLRVCRAGLSEMRGTAFESRAGKEAAERNLVMLQNALEEFDLPVEAGLLRGSLVVTAGLLRSKMRREKVNATEED